MELSVDQLHQNRLRYNELLASIRQENVARALSEMSPSPELSLGVYAARIAAQGE